MPKLARCHLLICDVDGVMTDGQLYYTDTGETLKAFHVHDGLGLQRLRAHGVQIAVISGRRSSMVTQRMHELGIHDVHQGVDDKMAVFEQLLKRLKLAASDVAYLGDDLPDLPVMTQVGFPLAVANAVPAVKAQAIWVTPRSGGHGAVRDAADYLLEHGVA